MENPLDESRPTQLELVAALEQHLAGAAPDPEQVARAVETLVDARVAELRAELSLPHGSGGFEQAVRSIVANLTRPPANWHQMVEFYLSSPHEKDAAPRARAPWWFVASVAMVLFQTAAAISIILGSIIVPCESNDRCVDTRPGMFCQLDMPLFEGNNRCGFCGERIPILFPEAAANVETGTTRLGHTRVKSDYNCISALAWGAETLVGPCEINRTQIADLCSNPSDTMGLWENVIAAVPASTVESWCAACVHPNTLHVDFMVPNRYTRSSRNMMRSADWVALILASFVIGLSIIGELRDISLCLVALQRPGLKLSTTWRRALQMLQFARRFVFLPALLGDVPLLVLWTGSDSLSICLNTLALLFLVEIDNVAYTFGLDAQIRARVEELGRVALTDEESRVLTASRNAHMLLIVVTIVACVLHAGFLWMTLPFVAFGVGAGLEAVWFGNEGARGVGKIASLAFAGFMAFTGLISLLMYI